MGWASHQLINAGNRSSSFDDGADEPRDDFLPAWFLPAWASRLGKRPTHNLIGGSSG
jgi:hypothetical protein